MEQVSIIMPTYNCGPFIAESVRSVLSQTYTNWELLIVDDCSTDNTAQVVASFDDPRIRYMQNEQNEGAATTRNRALRAAQGRYVAFLDADDKWLPTKLEKQIAFMQHNGYAFSYHAYSEIDEDDQPTGISVSGPGRVTQKGMEAFCWPGCLTVMYDTAIVGQIQIEDVKKNNDYALWLQVSKKADCYLLDEILAQYRRGRNGSISSHSLSTLIKWHYKLWRYAEKKDVIASLWYTGLNMVCGLYKKMNYVKRHRL